MKNYPCYEHEMFTNLRQLVEARARKSGDRIAFRYKRKKDITSVSYRKLREDVDALGGWFLEKGLSEVRIAVLGENSYDWIVTYFATVLSGNIIVPIDKELSNEDIATLLQRCCAKLLICSNTYFDIAQEMERLGAVSQILSMQELPQLLAQIPAALREVCEKRPVNENALCAIIYTSGTTGTPKGVMLSQRNLATDATAAAQYVLVTGDALLTLPLHHTFAFTAGVLGEMVWGMPICINQSLRRFASDMQDFQPQNMFLVPAYVEAMYRKIWDNAKKQGKEKALRRTVTFSNFLRKCGIDLRRRLFQSVLAQFGGNLDTVISGGAALNQSYADGLSELGIQVLNGYGITECAPVVAVSRNRAWKAHSVGLPLPCNEVRIQDGEICVRGDNVMLGYDQDEAATQEAMFDGWFHTGDLGQLDKDGFLFITGRKKNLIITENGENVSPEELEERILALPQILEVVVYAENSVITAEVYAEETDGVEDAVLALNKQLPPYKQIQRVKLRSTEFEKTTTEKIKRKQQG